MLRCKYDKHRYSTQTQAALYWGVDMYNTEGATIAKQFCDFSEIIAAAFLVYAALCK
jgi:hypothetical protein